MPVYEYVCDSCPTVTEKLRSVGNMDQLAHCDTCGNPARRVISSPEFRIKGGGTRHNRKIKYPTLRERAKAKLYGDDPCY